MKKLKSIIVSGPRMNVQIKCSDLLLTVCCDTGQGQANGEYVKCSCPACGSRLFDATTDSVGVVTIGCYSCLTTQQLLIGKGASDNIAA